MRKKPNNTRQIATLLGVAFLCILAFWPIRLTQVTVNQRQCWIRSPYFQLSWVHSVEKQPWQEWYQREGQGFLLSQTRFKSFGAGVPDTGKIEFTPDHWLLQNSNITLKEINWVISKRVQSSIVLGQTTWHIANEEPDYSVVHINNQSIWTWQLITKDFCHARTQ